MKTRPTRRPRSLRRSLAGSAAGCLIGGLVVSALTGAARPALAKSYKGAEVYTSDTWQYGRIEVRMRMMRGSGIVSTFFTYKPGSEISGTAWEELDIEALGKNDGKSWQSNLITGSPRKTSEQLYTNGTSLADAYHTYTLEWTPEYVAWFFDGVEKRRTVGGQAAMLTNPHTFRFNAWISDATGWAGAVDEAALPAYQFVNWIKYYKYDNGQFTLDWQDDFEKLDGNRWSLGDWTFDGNLVDFDQDNAVVKDGTLVLAITKEGMTGFKGTVPVDDGTTPAQPDGGTSNPTPSSGGGGCELAGTPVDAAPAALAMLGWIAVASWRRRRA